MSLSRIRLIVLMAVYVGTASIGFAQSSASSWSFEEALGTTVLDANGSNHGTLKNGVTRLTAGRIGKALRFDGLDDYGNFGDPVSLEAPWFSVALWVRRNGSQQDWAKILSKGNGTSAPWGSYKLEFAGSSDTIINWHLGFTDGSSVVAQSVTPLSEAQWVHLVGTYDGTAVRLYVNGALNAATPVNGKSVRFDAVPLTLGGYAGWGYFRGDLDEVRYFNYALSATEIQAVFSGPSPALTVSSPNTALTGVIGSVLGIKWNHNLSATSTSKIELSRDNGSTWALLAASVPNGNQTGSYTWTVTGPASTQARVRVTATNGSPSDDSDTSFSISDATLVLTSPNSSSVIWTTGQPASITWSSNLPSQESLKLELSTDGGNSYPILVASSTPADGSEVVTVASNWVTSSARVRITWLKDASRFDVSDANFTIQSPALTTVTFQPTTAIFPNPERGFTTFTDLSYPDFSWVNTQGNTLTRSYFRLDSYRNSALPQSFLDLLTSGFQKARQAGIKMIPRFTYNFPSYVNNDPDATQARIEQHLQQLAPILAANEDVIASMEAGFIGLWGEWHTSSNGLDTNTGAKAAILNALLAAVPQSRMVQLRYPSDMQLLNGPPITSAEAFTGSNRSRIGSHQDCFLASDDDWGTWGRGGNTIAYDKAYVAANGQYAVVGGETCNPNPPRSSCPTALSELASMHWSYLNGEWEPTVLQGFIDGGCHDEIDRKLGYRIKLLSGSYSQWVARGQTFQFNLQLVNEGFAAMFNARPVFAVIYNGTETYSCQINADPRRWAPSVTTTVSGSCVLPTSMTPGTYSWAMWLPDQAASLQNNSSYAVRFANQIVWNGSRGYNVLASTITITP